MPFRSARLAVDTGLAHKRWSREQGISYSVETLGDQESSVTTELERYAVWPGRATSYKVGPAFDLRAFHDAALAAGAMPLDVLERVVEEWVASRLPARG